MLKVQTVELYKIVDENLWTDIYTAIDKYIQDTYNTTHNDYEYTVNVKIERYKREGEK